MLVAVQCNAHIWASEQAHMLDEIAGNYVTGKINLPWDKFEYVEGDSDHFTWAGFLTFADEFVNSCKPFVKQGESIFVITDSTIDHNNWVDGTMTTAASDHVAQLLRTRLNLTQARVDAVSGSGFVARAHEGLHFRNRISSARGFDTIVVMGGWNDASRPKKTVRIAAHEFWNVLRDIARGALPRTRSLVP